MIQYNINNIKFLSILILSFCFTIGRSQGFKADNYYICLNNPVILRDTNAIPSGKTVVSRLWNFGDVTTTTTTLDSVSHTYSTASSFLTSLTITYSDLSTLVLNSTTPVVVSTKPTDSVYMDLTVTCPGVVIKIDPFYTPGSFPTIVSYNLDMGDGTVLSTVQSTVYYSYTQLGNFVATYTITDGGGCEASYTTNVVIIAPPKPKFYTDDYSCKDSIVTYINDTKEKQNYVYWNWVFQDSSNTTTNHTIDGSHTWKYSSVNNYVYLEGLNQYKCTGRSDTLKVSVDTTPILVITPNTDTTVCLGNSVQYKILGSDSIFWDNMIWGGQVTGDTDAIFTPQNSYVYTVYGKTPNCPKVGTEVKIHVVQPISAKITFAPDTILLGSTAEAKVTINAIYDSIRWLPITGIKCTTCDSTGASPLVTTTYSTRVYYSLNQYVCSSLDSAKITVINNCVPSDFKIPTAFTPNYDNLNDIFYLKGFSFKDIKECNIFDRWGINVFSSKNVPANDIRYGWNGKDQNIGDEMPSGLYIYNIQASCSNGQIVNFQGEINLIK